ncbi:Aldo/keto reductase [Dendrothele bispora CBS 962.96]|uniref:Aldo/keto reductase n=1 Tax=Dendrothele bispora (strain CBS 962.96) TaxID=1314807 RepID=A0A4S8KTJ1_DENBC|nr:Aldo/keto reductase [Dendrothele bispora CBS 962.96]
MSEGKVHYRYLGSSGLKVSVPILGAMSFGSPEWAKWVLDEEQSMEILNAAWDVGINTIDTANEYSDGESERIIGKFMQQHRIPRSRIVIATKCFHPVAPRPGMPYTEYSRLRDTRDFQNQYGLSRTAIFNAVDASLERLQTSYIDLLQIHRYDPHVRAEETMKALHDLVQMGKVRYIGACSMRAWQFAYLNEIAEKHGWTKFVSMQSEYSLLYREEEREMISYCKFNGIGVIPWAPVAGGLLARALSSEESLRSSASKGMPWERTLTDADQEIVKRVEQVARRRGKLMVQIALAWSAGKITSPIVGTSSVQRLGENVDIDWKLSDEEVEYLEEPYQPKPVRGHD